MEIGILFALYMLPWIVSLLTGAPDKGMVFILNLFLGWTFLFWVIALALACRSKPDRGD